MRVIVKFFAGPRERLGVSELVHDLPAGGTVRNLANDLGQVYPELVSFRLLYAVNSAYVPLDTELYEGDEVACIPPVGGG